MAFPNVSDIVATTIQSRSRQIADNVTKNNALLSRLNQRGSCRWPRRTSSAPLNSASSSSLSRSL